MRQEAVAKTEPSDSAAWKALSPATKRLLAHVDQQLADRERAISRTDFWRAAGLCQASCTQHARTFHLSNGWRLLDEARARATIEARGLKSRNPGAPAAGMRISKAQKSL
jgi:hypothetical protein